jgi:hypothetical protein
MRYEGWFERFVKMARGMPTLLCVAACGAPTMIGPEPNETSTEARATGAEQHLEAAQREEVRLGKHQELYDPRAKKAIRRCKVKDGEPEGGALDCWVETVNPTAIHDAEMRMHGDRAVFHRKAARDLRAAETAACGRLSTAAREDSPFARGHVVGVSPLAEAPAPSGGKPRLRGATIFLQPIANVTADQLQQAMDCYSAHQAVVGYGAITAETNRSPLEEPGSRARVRAMIHGYAVDVHAEDPFAAQAIWLRAQHLAVE